MKTDIKKIEEKMKDSRNLSDLYEITKLVC